MSERPLNRYIIFAAALFFTSFLVGIVMVRLDPSIGTTMMAAFRDQVVRQIMNDQTGVICVKIFLNNLVACLVLFLAGVTAGLLSLIVLGANGVLIGAVLEMVRSSRHSSPTRLISSSVSPSVRAIISRKRPVPAAHLSFMAKDSTLPSPSSRMILLSCPPMSMTVRAPGRRKWAPRAWQLISVTLSPPPMFSRP